MTSLPTTNPAASRQTLHLCGWRDGASHNTPVNSQLLTLSDSGCARHPLVVTEVMSC